MNLVEAVKLLDTPKDDDYGKVIIKSNIFGKWLVNSKYCICQCTHDWPNSYTPKKEDFEAED